MAVTHPLAPLTADEIAATSGALRDRALVGDDHRFAYITLDEPPKGETAPRRAEALVLDRRSGETWRGVVTVATGEVVAWERVATGNACILFEELWEAIVVVKDHPEWQAALKRRGVEDFDAVQCDPWPAGVDAIRRFPGRRVVRVVSYVRHHESDNGYAHPIEGVIATVDVTSGEVVEVIDEGDVPVPQAEANYDAGSVGPLRDDLRPVEITQPEGPSFTVEGNEVSWQKWRLGVSVHPLEGLVLHGVTYEDGGRQRPVLHRAALAEMVVPYGETAAGHWWKNAFDAGEMGLGRPPFLNSLELGCDCLGAIHYLDAVVADERGNPSTVANAVCIHEEDFGILWKHVDLETFTTEVRRQRRLVVSAIHTVGNYEYGFYWYFYLDGSIEVEIKLTGIVQTLGVAEGDQPRHSELVAPGVAAPHHQHLFCFRLDFDVDGTANSVYEVETEPVPTGPDNPHGNAFVSKETLLSRESEARRSTDASRSRHWRITSSDQRNVVGRPTAYRLVPGSAPALLAQPDALISQRAAFARHNVWVTPYRPDETRPAGFPNLHDGTGCGLPEWTAADRELTDTDVVVWYVCGATHVARPEDWPVMPVERVGFMLQPWGFFDRNPALDVPPPKGHCHSGSDAPQEAQQADS